MEDIEDLVAGGAPPGFRLPLTAVGAKPKRSRNRPDKLGDEKRSLDKDSVASHSSNIPRTQSDSEYMAGQLSAFGYCLSDNPEEADLWLINICTVKSPSQSATETLITKCKNAKRPLVVVGCVPQGSRDLKELEGASIIGVEQNDRVVEVVEETLKGHEVRLLHRKRLPTLDLPKVEFSHSSAILVIVSFEDMSLAALYSALLFVLCSSDILKSETLLLLFPSFCESNSTHNLCCDG